jgi:hypothetical protein
MMDGRSRADVVVYSVVAALAVAALALPPLAGALDARLSLTTLSETAERDPWGTAWVFDAHGSWSAGPDRRDDARGGDDIPLLPLDHPWLRFHRFGGELLFGLAVALAAGWELVRTLRRQLAAARGPGLSTEVGRAALMALPISLTLSGLVALVAVRFPAVSEALQGAAGPLVIAPGVALVATLYLGTAAVVLGLRLRRPAAEDGSAGPPKDGAPPDR